MKQLLAFPKKYEVTGKITKDRFLNSGNLTDAEKKVLELYLKNINILYDIRFLDQSEMIVLEIELTDAERGKYGLSNLVMHSVPLFRLRDSLLTSTFIGQTRRHFPQ